MVNDQGEIAKAREAIRDDRFGGADVVLVHSDEYANWVFDADHPTQGRRFVLAREMLLDQAIDEGVKVMELPADFLPERELLHLVHTSDYVDQVLTQGMCNEWPGSRTDLGALARRMAGGSFVAARALLEGRALTAVNFAGAKHHAMANHSSGFCVFNDLAMVAKYLLQNYEAANRIAIVDFDAHHGDGTEELLRDEPNAITFSIHDSTIFPWTGHTESPDQAAFNRPLAAGSGDGELLACIDDFTKIATEFEPDLVFVAMGADGHITDPLSTLNYSVDGMCAAIAQVRLAMPEVPFLLGGAGGYQPDSITPHAWAAMTLACASPPSP